MMDFERQQGIEILCAILILVAKVIFHLVSHAQDSVTRQPQLMTRVSLKLCHLLAPYFATCQLA